MDLIAEIWKFITEPLARILAVFISVGIVLFLSYVWRLIKRKKPFYCVLCGQDVDENPKLHAYKHWISSY